MLMPLSHDIHYGKSPLPASYQASAKGHCNKQGVYFLPFLVTLSIILMSIYVTFC